MGSVGRPVGILRHGVRLAVFGGRKKFLDATFLEFDDIDFAILRGDSDHLFGYREIAFVVATDFGNDSRFDWIIHLKTLQNAIEHQKQRGRIFRHRHRLDS